MGVCKWNVKKGYDEWDFSNLNHGYYVIFNNGATYSNHDEQINNKYNEFTFEENQKISCVFMFEREKKACLQIFNHATNN